ncbi:cell division protein FtsL [Aquabacterium sp. OR-4]|uniref:cell division protein FtsL n=1 Tax=Aquabacterium sp. OR-4 TaxID=2978127 RepID=UPI0021B39098|nr:cell division protein FtsL [Aquabacterium sp. OR-4]MDT7837225.1 cell division protein FtsL [Aquabacterium sp. OR-4]
MARLNVLLLAAVIASALWLVRNAYDARRLFAEIHRAEQEGLRLEGERTRLEAERQGQATSYRVDSTAREKLGMRTVTPAVTMYEGQATATLTEIPAGKAAGLPAKPGARADGAAR